MFIRLKEKGCSASQCVCQTLSRAVEDRFVVPFQSCLVVPSQETLLPWTWNHPMKDSHLEGSAPCGSWNPCWPAPLATAWCLWFRKCLLEQLFPPIYCCRLLWDVVVGKKYSLSARATSSKLIHLVPASRCYNLRERGLNLTSWSRLFPSADVALELDPVSSSSFSPPPCWYKRWRYVQRQCEDLFGFCGLDKLWWIEEVMKEVLHAFQPFLIRKGFPVSLVRHLGCCPLRCCYLNLTQDKVDGLCWRKMKRCGVHNFKSDESKSSIFSFLEFNSEPIEADGCRAD